jgi:hypothetical protein
VQRVHVLRALEVILPEDNYLLGTKSA